MMVVVILGAWSFAALVEQKKQPGLKPVSEPSYSKPVLTALSSNLADSLFSIKGRRFASRCHPIAAHAAPQQIQFFPRRFEYNDMKASGVSWWPFERRADIDARGSVFEVLAHPDTLGGCLEVLAPT